MGNMNYLKEKENLVPFFFWPGKLKIITKQYQHQSSQRKQKNKNLKDTLRNLKIKLSLNTLRWFVKMMGDIHIQV